MQTTSNDLSRGLRRAAARKPASVSGRPVLTIIRSTGEPVTQAKQVSGSDMDSPADLDGLYTALTVGGMERCIIACEGRILLDATCDPDVISIQAWKKIYHLVRAEAPRQRPKRPKTTLALVEG